MIIAELEQELTFDRFTDNPAYEVISHGYDSETGMPVDLPHCDPRAIGGRFDERISEWVIPNDWKKYLKAKKVVK